MADFEPVHQPTLSSLNRQLIKAIKDGRLEHVKNMLQAKADIEAVDSNSTPALFLACRSGNADIVKHLLDSKADPTHANANGSTPLVTAQVWDMKNKSNIAGLIKAAIGTPLAHTQFHGPKSPHKSSGLPGNKYNNPTQNNDSGHNDSNNSNSNNNGNTGYQSSSGNENLPNNGRISDLLNALRLEEEEQNRMEHDAKASMRERRSRQIAQLEADRVGLSISSSSPGDQLQRGSSQYGESGYHFENDGGGLSELVNEYHDEYDEDYDEDYDYEPQPGGETYPYQTPDVEYEDPFLRPVSPYKKKKDKGCFVRMCSSWSGGNA